MNRYSLSSDSDRWWYPTAIAGTIGAAAVSAIFVVPLVGAGATPVDAPKDDSGSVTIVERPCYLSRAGWNTPAGWEQPVCTTEVRRGSEGLVPEPRRVPPGYLP